MSSCTDPKTGALLHAWEIDTLDEADAERFEVHLLSCSHCFGEVEAFRDTSSLLLEDGEIRDLARSAARVADRARSRPESTGARIRRLLWPNAPLLLRPAVAWIFALLLLIPAYRGWRGGTHPPIQPVEEIYLLPDRAAADLCFPADAGENGLIGFLVPGATPGRPMAVEIRGEDGRIVFSDTEFDRFDPLETGRLLLPLGRMAPGVYRLSVTDPGGDPPIAPVEYRFRIAE